MQYKKYVPTWLPNLRVLKWESKVVVSICDHQLQVKTENPSADAELMDDPNASLEASIECHRHPIAGSEPWCFWPICSPIWCSEEATLWGFANLGYKSCRMDCVEISWTWMQYLLRGSKRKWGNRSHCQASPATLDLPLTTIAFTHRSNRFQTCEGPKGCKHFRCSGTYHRRYNMFKQQSYPEPRANRFWQWKPHPEGYPPNLRRLSRRLQK